MATKRNPNKMLIELMGQLLRVESLFVAALFISGCSGSTGDQASLSGPTRLKLIDTPNGSESVSASSIISVGAVYLDAQMAPVSVNGLPLQASDITVNGSNMYVSYSSYDTGGTVSKVGAVQLVKPYACDSLLTSFTDYCLSPTSAINFPNTDIFAAYSDGTDLYAVGSTSDETNLPYFGRLFKIGLDSGKAPTTVSATRVLPSYAGTGVVKTGSTVLATYGTSLTASLIGGIGAFLTTDLTAGNSQQLYDARSVAIDPSAANAYVIRGAVSSSDQGAVLKYPSSIATAATQTLSTGGNQIAESKSTVVVGNSLILATAGDGGFKVLCKGTGAVLATKAAPVIPGIPTAKTVTNGIAAIPGYLFTANGEGGVGVYTFQKSSALNTNYCQGITLTYKGRLALDSDNSDATYINAELSANSIKPLTILSVLNVVTSRMLVVASGNKGVSLLDMSALNVSLTDVDDF